VVASTPFPPHPPAIITAMTTDPTPPALYEPAETLARLLANFPAMRPRDVNREFGRIWSALRRPSHRQGRDQAWLG